MKKFFPHQKIDWQLLAKAQSYYEHHHFQSIETPYIVPAQYSEYTKPHQNPSFILNDGIFTNNPYELVGSAEQGFIFLLLNHHLHLHSKYLSITPCFRFEHYDETHQPWFIKLELFWHESSMDSLHQLIKIVQSFFEQELNEKIQILQTGLESFDLMYQNIELGSYGIRKIEEFSFIYGTGLALPRFSYAKNLNLHE